MSSNLEQRVLHEATDISERVNDYRTGTYTFPYETDEYLYVGSIFPFNNLFFELGTLNIVAASVSIDIWFGNAWVPAVDILDQTSGLTASGRIQWNTDDLKGWDLEQRSEEVTGLTGSVIYNMYWARFSWSAALTASTSIKYIGQKFANDDILQSFYPDLGLSNIKTAFESGKTTWDEQHYMAAEHIIRDLKKRNIIKSRSQLLDHSLFVDASCHKVASIIYQAFGTPYFEQLQMADKKYSESINLRFFNLDVNADGSLEPVERGLSQAFMRR